MSRIRMVVFLLAVSLATVSVAATSSAPDDPVRAELAVLAKRLDRLESENRELRVRNEALERRMTALQELVVGDARPPASATQPDAAAAPAGTPAAVAAVPSGRPDDNVRVSGYVFGDAYVVAANHDPSVDGQNGFWIRRGYLTFDADLAERWSSRLRFEVNSPGDFTTNSKLEPFVKDAYLAWKHGGQEAYFGLSPSPTFEFVEGFWGERPLEKTPLDLYRMGSSRDLGVAYKGDVHEGRFFYHAMLGNGAGDGAETNKGKKIMAAVGLRPTESIVAQAYADYEDRPGETDRATWQLFVGWSGAHSRLGLQYAAQTREVTGAPDDDLSVASAFGRWKLTDAGTLVARYDRSFDGYPDASRIPYFRFADDVPFDLAILGWEHALPGKISLIPNLEYVRYRGDGDRETPDDDLYARLTLYYPF